jgi:myo-inositol-1(or 4)-monophosphatase
MAGVAEDTWSWGDFAQLALEVASAAGALLLDGRIGAVESKSNANDVVTDLDRASEALLVSLIRERRPADAIFGEEGSDVTGATGVRWVIDPLDGTVNYLYGIPAWSVSVGVEADGASMAGAVVAPAMGESYVAWAGGGSYRLPWGMAVDSESVRGYGRPLEASSVVSLEGALIGTGFSYDPAARAEQGALVARVVPVVRDIRRFGSAALDLCAVAAGRLDGYFERGLNPWDVSAGNVIAREAGASVDVFDDGLVIASSPSIHRALLDLVR